MKPIFYILICMSIISCKGNKLNSQTSSKSLENKSKVTNPKNWQYQDYEKDTVPGVSLNRAYDEIIKDKKGSDVIIAVIDTEVDINHEDLKNQIWTNSKELSNDKKDNDDNGYVDDLHGWNFIGNEKGENIIHSNFELVRIIRKYEPDFGGKTAKEIPPKNIEQFEYYSQAKITYKETLETYKKRLSKEKKYLKYFLIADSTIKIHFPEKDFSIKELKKINTQDTILAEQIGNMIKYKKIKLNKEKLEKRIKQTNDLINFSLNLDYNEKSITGDNPKDINDVNYGNGNVSGNIEKLYHGTLVAGVISATRNNEKGVDGFSNSLKLMPLCVSSNGDEHDKDIALAIRYAVDNGAKIINMSSGKNLSLNREWITDALIYASKKNVLFITSAGNDNLNLDIEENNYFPNDNTGNTEKVITNFIMVGATSKKVDKNLKYVNSSYGKDNVDLFAPGKDIYTTAANNKYRNSKGTSMATPIVSGIAGLLWSYYPDLSALQVKEILMNSGTSYDIEVEIKLKNKTKKTVPFSELSKSGKIVNAYNALLMAAEISKTKTH